MVIFRCKQSGNTVSFECQNDIDSMNGHDGYERVEETVLIVEPVVEEIVKPAVKKGRPRKIVN